MSLEAVAVGGLVLRSKVERPVFEPDKESCDVEHRCPLSHHATNGASLS